MTDDRNFTPALGFHGLTAAYDRVLALATRETVWRRRMLVTLAPEPGQTIVDLGAGTGSFALMTARACPGARIVATDPDPAVRIIAERKFARADLHVDYGTAGGDESPPGVAPGSVDQVTISLVLHQCPDATKRAILGNAFRLLREGGRLLLCDYGPQRSPLAFLGFHLVRLLDGFENTRANMAGRLPPLMADAGFVDLREEWAIPTPTGIIALHSGVKGQHRDDR